MPPLKLPPAFRHRAFVGYLLGSFVSNVGNSIQAAAILLHVYLLTNSSLMVGMLGLVRIGPLLLFSLFGGVLADQADRRKILLSTQLAMAAVSICLFALTEIGLKSVVPLYVMVAINAIARAFDGPARQSLQVGLVPIEDYPNAASINGMAWRMSDILGPIIAGLVIKFFFNGLALCYALNVLTFVAVLIAVWRLPAAPPKESQERPRNFGEVVGLIKDGLKFVGRTPVVRSAMWVDFWATLLSGADALLPAFATKILRLGPDGYGVLAASSGIGALIAATTMAWLPTVNKQGKLVVAMIACYGLATICFGLSPNLLAASFSLAAVGASDMISTVLRQTIRQLATPDELRGRMTATSSLFHISGPQLGDFEAGAVAQTWGERFSIILGGGLCLLVAGHWSRAKALTDYVHQPNGGQENSI